MNQHVGKSNFIRKFTAIALSLLFCKPTFAQSVENQQIVFEGSLTDSGGNSIDLAGAQLTFYVSANGCYLYGETSSASGDSQGNIVHRIGGGSQVAGSPNSFTQNIFFGTVTGSTSFASNNCTVLPGDTRLAQVYYAAQNISATIKLGTVPYAHNATMLNGKNAADFVEVSNDSNTLLYSGTAGQFLSKSASGSLTWTNSSMTAAEISTTLGTLPAANLPSFSGDISTAAGSASAIVQGLRGVTLAATAPVSGQILYYNGVAWSPMTIPANVGTVTAVSSANSDISVVSGSSSPILTLNSGAGANQIVKLDASARLPSVDASQLIAINAANITSGTLPTGRLPSFSGDVTTVTGSSTVTVTKLRGFNISATAPSANQVLAFMGGNWTPANAPTGSVTTVMAGTGLSGGPITSSGTLSVNFGTSSGTVAAGNDTRLVQALQSINNLSDVANVITARTNLGLGGFATANTVDLGSASATGILANARLPAFTGDVVSTASSNTLTVTKLRGVTISATLPTSSQVLAYNGSQWVPTNSTVGTVTNVNAGTGLLGGVISTSGTISVNFGTGSGTVAQGNDARIVQALQSANNLSDVTSSGSARANLGLGTLATKNSVNLATAEVTGVLPLANGGSPWLTHANGYYTVSNTAIGTSAVLTNIKLSVEGNTPSQVAKFNNTATNGYGVRIDVAGSSPAQYALNVNNASGSILMVQNDGYIGIGTLSPTAGLNLVNDNGPATKDDIQINTYGSNTPALALQKAKGNAGAPTPLLANENIGNLRWDGYTGSAYANLVAVSGYAETNLGTAINSYLTISTNSNGTMAERVRVSSNGNVGIGTSNPTSRLQVSNDDYATISSNAYSSANSYVAGGFAGFRARGTASLPSFPLGGDRLAYFNASNGVNPVGYSGIEIFSTETHSDSNQGSEIRLVTVPNATTTGQVRMTVTNNGNIGIGTPTPQAKLHVAGAIVSKPQIIATGSVLDLSLSNMFILNSVGGSAITLNNIVEGGTYTVIVTDPAARAYTFTGCTTSYYAPANSLTVAGTRTMFGVVTVKNGANWDCYISWTPGYQ